jgi:hypothetical protein
VLFENLPFSRSRVLIAANSVATFNLLLL